MIARTWRGTVRAADADAYVRYIADTGLPASLATPVNRGFWLLHRLDGERAEVLTVSLWESLEAVKGFAGEEVGRAVFYPRDAEFLVERDMHVDHWDVASAATQGIEPRPGPDRS